MRQHSTLALQLQHKIHLRPQQQMPTTAQQALLDRPHSVFHLVLKMHQPRQHQQLHRSNQVK